MDIKTKNISDNKIKTLNRTIKEMKQFKKVKEEKKQINNHVNNSENIYSYAGDKVQNSSKAVSENSVNLYNKIGKKSVVETKKNIIKSKEKINEIRDRITNSKKVKNVSKGIKQNMNNYKRSLNTINNKMKKTYKMKEHIINVSNKTYKGVKKTFATTVNSIKTIISGTKALVLLLIAGSWISVLVIIIVCVISLLLNSVFGIFFSNEKIDDSVTMSSVVKKLNDELNEKIEKIKIENVCDDYEVSYDIADWKNVLALYSVMQTNSNYNNSLAILDEKKIKNISEIFWNMNQIDYIQREEVSDSIEKKQILSITIKSKSLEEMINEYNFSSSQQKQLNELLNNDYNSLWKGVINGNIKSISGKYAFPVGDFYTITQFFSNTHKAIDISSNYGSNIYSISDGEVYIIKDGCIVGDLSCNGKGGNYVVIKHNDNRYYSVYMHLKSIKVRKGDTVSSGEIIGYMGNTGNVEPIPDNINSKKGTHLHFSIYENVPFINGNEIDPSYFFDLK